MSVVVVPIPSFRYNRSRPRDLRDVTVVGRKAAHEKWTAPPKKIRWMERRNAGHEERRRGVVVVCPDGMTPHYRMGDVVVAGRHQEPYVAGYLSRGASVRSFLGGLFKRQVM